MCPNYPRSFILWPQHTFSQVPRWISLSIGISVLYWFLHHPQHLSIAGIVNSKGLSFFGNVFCLPSSQSPSSPVALNGMSDPHPPPHHNRAELQAGRRWRDCGNNKVRQHRLAIEHYRRHHHHHRHHQLLKLSSQNCHQAEIQILNCIIWSYSYLLFSPLLWISLCYI